MISKEDMLFLKQFEMNFKTAIEGNWSRNIPESQLKRMIEIYENETGNKHNVCTHCQSSILRFLKMMGALYNKTKEEYSNGSQESLSQEEGCGDGKKIHSSTRKAKTRMGKSSNK